MTAEQRKAGFILLGIAVLEGTWVYFNMRMSPTRFFRYAGLIEAHAGALGWLLAVAVFVGFATFSARLPSVRANLFRPSLLKVLAIAVAITAGFCEEAVFRKFFMDRLAGGGYGVVVQIAASGMTFGLAHGVWGAFRGSFVAAIGATVVTGVLGAMLAMVYIASHRVLAPCIVAHGLINLVAEPGLVLAAVRGEMSRDGSPPSSPWCK
jgi:membrane protease YdiL (CAAX protease family)